MPELTTKRRAEMWTTFGKIEATRGSVDYKRHSRIAEVQRCLHRSKGRQVNTNWKVTSNNI